MNTSRRLEELRALPEDWDTYGSPPITEAAIEKAKIILTLLRGCQHLHAIVPVPGGGVQLEFWTGEEEMEIEIFYSGEVAVLAERKD